MSHNTEAPSPHQREWLRAAVQAGRPMSARRHRPLPHNLINTCVLVAIVGTIAGTTALSSWLPPILFVVVGGLAYGLAFYASLGIVVHEASHRMFFLSQHAQRTRAANRVVGWICSVPFAIHYERHWEHGHAVHHAQPFEPEDPQAFNAATGCPLLRTVLPLLLAPGYFLFHRLLQKRPSGRGGSSGNVMLLFAGIWVVVGAATVLTLGWHVLAALVFGLQVLAALNQIKGALEHGGPVSADPNPLLRSRNTLFLGWPVLWLFYVSIFHFEHHLLPTVPWYALPRFHRAARERVPAALHQTIFNRHLLRQLAGRVGAIPAEP